MLQAGQRGGGAFLCHSKGPIPHSCLALRTPLRLELLRVFSRMLFLLTKPTGTFCMETLRSYMPLLAGEGVEGSQTRHLGLHKAIFQKQTGKEHQSPMR